jgi:dihydrofolate reductase
MTLEAIVAMSLNRCIGVNGKLPWDYPEDMAHFRKKTRSRVVIMGRKTYESIGHPLPKRINVVLTQDPKWTAEGVHVVHSKEEALSKIEEVKTFLTPIVIGGEQIYRLFLDEISIIHLTLIKKECEGDSFFPELPEHEWEMHEAISSIKTPGLQFQTWNKWILL